MRLLLIFLSITFLSISCLKEEESDFEYPEEGFYDDNILYKGQTEYNSYFNSFQCKVPKDKSVKIVITNLSDDPGDNVGQVAGTVHNWAIGMGEQPHSVVFNSINGEQTSDAKLSFAKGIYQIDYYEDHSPTPNFTKKITVKY